MKLRSRGDTRAFCLGTSRSVTLCYDGALQTVYYARTLRTHRLLMMLRSFLRSLPQIFVQRGSARSLHKIVTVLAVHPLEVDKGTCKTDHLVRL